MARGNIWNIEKIKEGFDKFYELYGHYPTDYEINDFKFLPTPRQIQRRFGGLVNLRKTLGLEINNYGTGKERSRIATSINQIGRKCEVVVFEMLKAKFGEEFVHIERPVSIYDTKNRYDFFIYSKPNNFAVDVLSTEGDIRSFIKIMNIKENKYRNLNTAGVDLYFVYFGDRVSKERIVKWQQRKKNELPLNWKMFDLNEFKDKVDSYSRFNVS